MKAITSCAILALSLFVALAAFADNKPRGASFKVEISGVDAGVLKLKLSDGKLQCPKTSGATNAGSYNLIDTFPLHVRLDALESSKTHVISSGGKSIKLTGVSDTAVNKENRAVTFNFRGCE